MQSDAGINPDSEPNDLPKGNGGLRSKTDSPPQVDPDEPTAVATPRSDLLLAQEDLRWSEKRYRKIFEHSKDGIIVLDAQQHLILDLNQSMAAMFGYSRDELLSRPITDIWPDSLNQVVALAQSLIDGGQVSGMNLACELRDGRQIQLEISASLIDFDSLK